MKVIPSCDTTKGDVGMPSEPFFSKVGGIASILGVVCLVIATFAHPMTADPANASAAFAEYAADRNWIASHLGQLLGVALLTGGLLALSWRLRRGRAGVWAILGGAGAIIGLSLSSALQAVDGIALKIMVDRWAAVEPEMQSVVFEAAFAVRQIEIGLASMVMLLSGTTALLYAGAFRLCEDAPDWLGWLAMLSGVMMLLAGIMSAYAGFSGSAMGVSMTASSMLMLWGIAVGVFLFGGVLGRPPKGKTKEQHA